MKTDRIEIFQTVRAALQPYATLDFRNRTNSEMEYDLWSDKNNMVNGEPRNELFFASLKIVNDHVEVDILPDDLAEHEPPFMITELDEVYLNQIEGRVAAAYKLFKGKGWI